MRESAQAAAGVLGPPEMQESAGAQGWMVVQEPSFLLQALVLFASRSQKLIYGQAHLGSTGSKAHPVQGSSHVSRASPEVVPRQR